MQLSLRNTRFRLVMAAGAVLLALSVCGSASSNFKKATPAIIGCPLGPFNLMVPPNLQSKWAIFAIAPNLSGRATPQRDAGLARFAASQISRNGNWQRSSVFVIRNRKAMDLFLKLQRKNQGKTIDFSNFRDMTTVWNNTSVYYDVRGKIAKIYYPQKTRLPWWKILR